MARQFTGTRALSTVEPGEAVDRLHQRAVAEAGGFERGHLAGGEEAAEGGQAEAGLAAGERAEGDAQALPAVVVVVPGGAADGAAAEVGEGVAVGVEAAGVGGGVGGVQQVAVLGDHQED